MIQSALAHLVERRDLSQQQAFDAMSEIMSGNATEAQIAGFLVGLRMKGETTDEIAGCARVMREKAVAIRSIHPDVVDTCGTGGDGSGTFNISTAAAIVAAGSGVAVAKHGNRSVSSKCGSADVLKALGVNIELPPDRVSRVLDEVGITFMFAPMMHQAMKFAVTVRKDLALRTVFNILGPLTNPARAQRQVLGVFAPHLTETLAGVLKELGSIHALVVHGEGNLDELSTLGKTRVSELKDGTVRTYTVDAADYGFAPASIGDLAGTDPASNAAIIRDVFEGTKNARRDIVLFNAGAAVFVAGRAASLKEGIAAAADAVDSGAAAKKLNQWIESTKS